MSRSNLSLNVRMLNVKIVNSESDFKEKAHM